MVSELRAVHFRCWQEFSLKVPPQGVLITGDNAQGKTSILEALCILLRLHSPRTKKMQPIIQHGQTGFGIAGTAWDLQRKVKYQDSFLLECEQEERKSPTGYLADGGLLVWMGNEDLELIRGSGDVRRRFLDFIGMQWQHSYRIHLSKYKRAQKAKSLLLREPIIDEKQIAAYEAIMIEHGQEISRIRAEICAALQNHTSQAQQDIGGKAESVTVEYRAAGGLDFSHSLAQLAQKERYSRQCLVGPHRDDVLLYINGMLAAEYASEGQQRTLALALKLAQGKMLEEKKQITPVYLLDDIFGELDAMRRNALMTHLPQHAQKWITTTSLTWLESADAFSELLRCHVSAGKIL